MKIKVSTIFKIWICIIVAIESQVFLAFGIDNVMTTYIKWLSPVILFFICLFNKGIYAKIKPFLGFINPYFMVYFAFFFFEAIYTVNVYGTAIDIYLMVKNYSFLSDILLLYPLLYIMQSEKSVDGVVNIVIFISLFANLQRFVNWFIYNFKGISLFPELTSRFLGLRNGRYRCTASKMHSLAFDLSLSRFYQNRYRKKIYLLICLFFFGFQVYVSQGRTEDLCYIITFMFVTYFVMPKYFTNHKDIKIMYIISISAVGIALLYTGVVSDFVSSFSTNSSESGSTLNRLYSINYYWGQVKNHILVGMGFLYDDPAKSGFLYSILRGNSGSWQTAFFEDFGILGQFFNYGLIGALILLSQFIRYFKILRKEFKKRNDAFIFLLPLFIHSFIDTILPMSIFQAGVYILVPFYFAFFEYVNVCGIKNNRLNGELLE